MKLKIRMQKESQEISWLLSRLAPNASQFILQGFPANLAEKVGHGQAQVKESKRIKNPADIKELSF